MSTRGKVAILVAMGLVSRVRDVLVLEHCLLPIYFYISAFLFYDAAYYGTRIPGTYKVNIHLSFVNNTTVRRP